MIMINVFDLFLFVYHDEDKLMPVVLLCSRCIANIVFYFSVG